ncbi:hypothetical protein Tco_0749557 [Tanacetum coccineum]|uniref:Uncharacterized protein n=1 Tax=Tanacetum coccineum TaxID=301880 RepID=A0ABQ4YZS5_9ASTR
MSMPWVLRSGEGVFALICLYEVEMVLVQGVRALLLPRRRPRLKGCNGTKIGQFLVTWVKGKGASGLDKSTKKAYYGMKGNSLSTWGEVDMVTEEAQPEEPKEAKAIKEAELSKPKIMKVVAEMVNEAEVQISRRKEFLKHQESHLQVLSKAHNEKLKKKAELKNKSYDNYVWTITSRKKPEKINEIYIHLRTRPITITIYRNNNPRNFKVLKNFKFGDFSLSEWDERNAINPKKSK